VDLGQRHIARAAALDGLEDVGVLDARLPAGRPDYSDLRGISESVLKRQRRLSAFPSVLMTIVLVLGSRQVAGIGIQDRAGVQRASVTIECLVPQRTRTATRVALRYTPTTGIRAIVRDARTLTKPPTRVNNRMPVNWQES